MDEHKQDLKTSNQQEHQAIDLMTLGDAQDGSELLFAVAQLLEAQHGKDYGYALLVRRNANAIRDITDHLQPWTVATEKDPALKAIWRNISPREEPTGAGAHKTELKRRLGVRT